MRMLCLGLLASAQAWLIVSLAPAPASAAPVLPPELVGLEQKMTSLQVSTETFETKYELGTPEGESFHLGLLYGISGEATLSPLQANLKVHVGKRIVPERLIGETLYVYEPRLSKLDKGKPWVQIEHETLQKVIQFDPSGAPEANPLGAFANLLSIVNGSESVKQVGQATIDKQPTTEFVATLNPQVLLGVFTKEEYEALDFFGQPTVELRVYISAVGVPVRTQLLLNIKGIKANADVDILAYNQPVAVQVPPADQTISQAERKALTRLEEKLKLEKQKAKQRRSKARRHGKHHKRGRHKAAKHGAKAKGDSRHRK
jgi:hypothetical protein